MCAGYLSSPYAESEYMDCMRNTMDYSKYFNTNTITNDDDRNTIEVDGPPTNTLNLPSICDRCVCTMTGRSDWHMCAVS